MPSFRTNRLNGLFPLSYTGVNPVSPQNFATDSNGPPTSNDSRNFYIGDLWLDTSSDTAGGGYVAPKISNLWILVSLDKGQATWIPFGGGTGTIITLTGDTGGPVPPTAGNINILGNPLLTVAGNPATSTLTLNLSGHIASIYTADVGVAVPSGGNLNVFGGTSGRDINTSASGSTIHIDLDNAITLGDLAVIPAGNNALTIASGDITMTEDQTVASSVQMIKIGSGNGHGGRIFFYQDNIFMGQGAGNTTMSAGVSLFNIGIGQFSGSNLTTGLQNVGVGNGTISSTTTAQNTVALGYVCLGQLTTGVGNVGVGSAALHSIVTGSSNTAVGTSAGSNYTTSESSNICIGASNLGVIGESNVLRIGGATGTGTGQLNQSFIAGIRGITTVNNDAIAVLIDSAGQLGTVSSSRRYKKNIEDMKSTSDPILKLRPVTFTYKTDSNNHIHYGLIAEEVDELMPNLVVRDDGEPTSIKYHELPILLLNEFQKLSRRFSELENKYKQLQVKIDL